LWVHRKAVWVIIFHILARKKATALKIFSSGGDWIYEKVTLHRASFQKCNHGNMRELENILERAATIEKKDIISMDFLPLPVIERQDCNPEGGVPPGAPCGRAVPKGRGMPTLPASSHGSAPAEGRERM
jgi:hypothetical protein